MWSCVVAGLSNHFSLLREQKQVLLHILSCSEQRRFIAIHSPRFVNLTSGENTHVEKTYINNLQFQ